MSPRALTHAEGTIDRPRLHVIGEYGATGRPHASAFLRLIRPLSHPIVAACLDVTFDSAYDGEEADAVVVDRLWRPDVTPDRAGRLVDRVRRAGARLIYCLDDNLLDLPAERADWPTRSQIAAIEAFLDGADAVVVTSASLGERLRAGGAHAAVLPNALDERLLGRTVVPSTDTPFGRRPVTIGYMGTATHADDLALVAPALRRVCDSARGDVSIELVGVAARDIVGTLLGDLPVRILAPKVGEDEYPLFLVWFTTTARWDIAVAPLLDTPFKRCKSDVKALDYAAIGAAGVFSRVAPYAASVRDGETGLLVDNEPGAWADALRRLVDDPCLRADLAHGAARRLHADRVLSRAGPRWVETFGRIAAPR